MSAGGLGPDPGRPDAGGPDAGGPGAGGEVASAGWAALGTSALVAVTELRALAGARAAVEAELAAVDRACSRFRDDSELSLVNAAGGAPVSVTAGFAHAVAVALRVARATDGLVDPTLGAELRAAGYDRDFALLEPAGGGAAEPRDAGTVLPSGRSATPGQDDGRPQALSRRRRQAWRAVEVDELLGIVRLPPGVALDLGATAKALAADRAARAAHARTGAGALVALGGDLAVSGAPPEGGWTVRVVDDHAAGPDAPGQTVTIRGGGLASSGTTVRRWRTGEGAAHHILDPRTGAPADGPWRTATVAAASCVDANAASTAAIVRGTSAPAWLERIGMPARLVRTDGVVFTLAGWPDDPADPRAGRTRRIVVFLPSDEPW